MAKALFHRHQRVFVKPVGTFAIVEKVIPHWVKDVAEPIRVTYEVGLGREFTGSELISEAKMNAPAIDDLDSPGWHVYRMKGRWHQGEDCAHHPYPGTFPVVVTDEKNWGGWRVPAAEYDRDPGRIEYQARVISNAPRMIRVLRDLVQHVSNSAEKSEELTAIARAASVILREVYQVGETAERAAAE